MIGSASHHLVNATEEPTEIHSVLSSKRHSPMPGVFFISYESILIITICFQREMGALTSIPLCQRARGAEEGGDTNNNLQGEEDRNITQVTKIKVVIIRIKQRYKLYFSNLHCHSHPFRWWKFNQKQRRRQKCFDGSSRCPRIETLETPPTRTPWKVNSR